MQTKRPEHIAEVEVSEQIHKLDRLLMDDLRAEQAHDCAVRNAERRAYYRELREELGIEQQVEKGEPDER